MKTVLIVDDSSFMRRLINKVVTKNGYIVVGEAGNGKIGFDKFMELRPDIVTLDLVMDEMNGLDVLKQIINTDPNASVIMISSMGQEVIVRDAIMLGAKNFLHKPFDEQQIIDAFEKL